jgi:hypothetical protein
MEWMKYVQRRFAQKLSVFAATVLVAGTAFAHVFPQKQEPGAVRRCLFVPGEITQQRRAGAATVDYRCDREGALRAVSA